jgi:hypothetical protein
MSSGSSLTSKLYDKIIKMLSKSHETIPLSPESTCKFKADFQSCYHVHVGYRNRIELEA